MGCGADWACGTKSTTMQHNNVWRSRAARVLMPRRHQLVLRVFSSSSHSWQAGQRQRRSASLNRGRRCASQSRPSTGRCMHQQAVNACPACCAHWLGWPHSGHCKTRSFACAEAGLVLLAQEVLAGMAKRGQRRLLRNREHGFSIDNDCFKIRF